MLTKVFKLLWDYIRFAYSDWLEDWYIRKDPEIGELCEKIAKKIQ